MQLQTQVPIVKPNFNITHQDQLLSIGSCFAQNMATFFEERKFQIISNPFGILYNPLSIAHGLEMVLNKKEYLPEDLFYYNERWNSYDHHSVFSAPNVDDALQNVNQQIEKAHHQLLSSKVLIITFGTAFVYSLKENNRAVANCHKVPAKDFDKRMLDVNEVSNSISKAINAIRFQNPNLKIIFTISPIRHIRDGFIENQQSKATLVLAVKSLTEQLSNTYYFPSYELVLDELRDYRFYNSDMVHLNTVSLEYIWQKFATLFFDDATLQLNQQFLKLRKAMLHRPFNPNSEQHQRFLAKKYEQALQFQKQFEYLNFSKELDFFKIKI